MCANKPAAVPWLCEKAVYEEFWVSGHKRRSSTTANLVPPLTNTRHHEGESFCGSMNGDHGYCTQMFDVSSYSQNENKGVGVVVNRMK